MPASILARPAITDYAPYYDNYIKHVPAGDLVAFAESQIHELRALLAGVTEAQSRFRYAPDKWSLREVIGHLIDPERVFSYRATAFSRGDAGALPSFDQAAWAPMGAYDDRGLDELLDEWETVRRATVALMRYMPEAALHRRGIASTVDFTVLALLFISPGHVGYHLDLLQRDYLDALQ
ncbi:MAG: DinB family protein [Gemmatimonadaceae bacterium]|nr:DinB family protein [Gemmatimonadaceae bacterium]